MWNIKYMFNFIIIQTPCIFKYSHARKEIEESNYTQCTIYYDYHNTHNYFGHTTIFQWNNLLPELAGTTTL
jgi:hypothetical protein